LGQDDELLNACIAIHETSSMWIDMEASSSKGLFRSSGKSRPNFLIKD